MFFYQGINLINGLRLLFISILIIVPPKIYRQPVQKEEWTSNPSI